MKEYLIAATYWCQVKAEVRDRISAVLLWWWCWWWILLCRHSIASGGDISGYNEPVSTKINNIACIIIYYNHKIIITALYKKLSYHKQMRISNIVMFKNNK